MAGCGANAAGQMKRAQRTLAVAIRLVYCPGAQLVAARFMLAGADFPKQLVIPAVPITVPPCAPARMKHSRAIGGRGNRFLESSS